MTSAASREVAMPAAIYLSIYIYIDRAWNLAEERTCTYGFGGIARSGHSRSYLSIYLDIYTSIYIYLYLWERGLMRMAPGRRAHIHIWLRRHRARLPFPQLSIYLSRYLYIHLYLSISMRAWTDAYGTWQKSAHTHMASAASREVAIPAAIYLSI